MLGILKSELLYDSKVNHIFFIITCHSDLFGIFLAVVPPLSSAYKKDSRPSESLR